MFLNKNIRKNFFTGLLVIAPVAATGWILYFIIVKLNLWLLDPINNVFNRLLPARLLTAESVEFLIKVLIFLLSFFFIILVGYATRIILFRNIFGFGEKVLYKVPMISTIYKTIKEISHAFLSQENTIFQKVVLIEYPRKGVYQLGFVVSDKKGEVQDRTKQDMLNIFVPTTPNPTTGILVFMPKEEIIFLQMSVSEGMKMIISGGAVISKNHYGDSKNPGSAA